MEYKSFYGRTAAGSANLSLIYLAEPHFVLELEM